ncbi:MAG TPA: multicopper oxidase family protein [Geminicoccus sp.]|jgi:FtsP/CotA-like multicopper oxidase with cupredoxin domain|uniref:multicopper oxidase family protein n=1 Tax=Geminicoccus sp. TaxID=2024832 RepID=UPI002E34C732|nr:multicopper oxidase family protein [Geminicoccus sp.]HEX2526389.1 multicopper oxidase family protein [Geminicoccus sp.]
MAWVRGIGRLGGALALAGMVALGALPGQAGASGAERGAVPSAAVLDDLPNPPEMRSKNGVLAGTLRFKPAEIVVRGRKVVSNVVNGNYMAPTLRIRPGDTIRVKAVNEIGPSQVNISRPQPTNVHFHGMDVSPKLPNGDNVFLRINSGQDLRYDVFVPKNHPQGLHWYHAHVHHYVDDQISSGISGMLIVDGAIESQYPELARLRQRVMVFKDFTFPGFKDGDARAKSLNGFANPPIRSRPGEFQIWHLGNLGADAFFDMKLTDHKVWLIERDGNLLLDPVRIDHVFLPPGARATVVVQAGKAGRYPFRHQNVDTGPAGDPNPSVQLGTFVVDGVPRAGGGAILQRLRNGPAYPKRLQPNAESVAKLKVDRTRYIDFSESADGDTFFINNKTYKESRIDVTTRVGQVERWIVRNYSQEYHVFHLHQTEFLVKQVSGDPNQTLGGGLRDVVNIPYAVNGKPGFAELIVPFTNPIIAGQFVFHCHLVQHEDQGMMANIRVLPRQTMAEQIWDKVTEFAGLDLPALWQNASAAESLDAQLEANICRSDTTGQVAVR